MQFTIHIHPPIRAQDDILRLTQLSIEHSVKTLAFSANNGQLVLAAIPGQERISYGRLVRAAGLRRSDLKPAESSQLAALGMNPGGNQPDLS